MINRLQECRLFNGTARLALLGVAVAMPLTAAHAAGTPAGTNIANTATCNLHRAGGATQSVDSNTVTLRVDEVLDVSVASADTGDVGTTPGATNQILKFTLTNGGNGPEAFVLTAARMPAGRLRSGARRR
jgi:hypothetical protein